MNLHYVICDDGYYKQVFWRWFQCAGLHMYCTIYCIINIKNIMYNIPNQRLHLKSYTYYDEQI